MGKITTKFYTRSRLPLLLPVTRFYIKLCNFCEDIASIIMFTFYEVIEETLEWYEQSFLMGNK